MLNFDFIKLSNIFDLKNEKSKNGPKTIITTRSLIFRIHNFKYIRLFYTMINFDPGRKHKQKTKNLKTHFYPWLFFPYLSIDINYLAFQK